jgi:60 kDa SS-A/Ro ribonucleoprotein
VLRNLRLMLAVGVSAQLIRERLAKGVARALPFRYVTAARYAPKLEDALEAAMFHSIAELPKLAGATGLLVDVSGSMNTGLARKGETTRMDAAAGLAILLREKAEELCIATFSDNAVHVAPRRGFALRDGIVNSQAHSGTYLKRALEYLKGQSDWQKLDRLIVVTDEQSHDGILPAWTPKAYVVNVAPYKNGVSYGNGWTHVDGWSERVIDYIAAVETELAA